MRRERRPILADEFVRNQSRSLCSRDTVTRVQRRVKDARHFVLDDNAIKRLGEVCRDIPDLIFRESKFARAPYEVTWIEIPNMPLLWETIMRQTSDVDADKTLGFLIDHDSVYVISDSGRLLPIYYELKVPWPEASRHAFAERCGVSVVEIEAFSWGYMKDGLAIAGVTDPNSPQAALRSAHSIDVLPLAKDLNLKKVVAALFVGGAGELRTLITLLLLLNRPTLTKYVQDVPHYRGFIKGKQQTFFQHHVVTIDLDPQPTLHMLGTLEGESISRRRHEVRGTWCHNYDAREYAKIGCIHEWVADPDWIGQDDPDDPDHWLCSVCEGRRWWRNEMTRGDSSKGYVVKTYNVGARTRDARQQR